MAGRVFAGVGRVFTNALGQTVTYTPAGGEAVSLQGVFTQDYVSVGADGNLQSESVSPAVSLRLADVPNVAQGDVVRIDGTDYTTVNVQPDGFGMVTLILHEAA